MAKGDIDTVPHGDGWANRVEGNQRVSNTAKTKAAAQKQGREMARKARVEHHIHNKDGRVGQRNSYGNDPRRSKGWPSAPEFEGGMHETSSATGDHYVLRFGPPADAALRCRRSRGLP